MFRRDQRITDFRASLWEHHWEHEELEGNQCLFLDNASTKERCVQTRILRMLHAMQDEHQSKAFTLSRYLAVYYVALVRTEQNTVLIVAVGALIAVVVAIYFLRTNCHVLQMQSCLYELHTTPSPARGYD